MYQNVFEHLVALLGKVEYDNSFKVVFEELGLDPDQVHDFGQDGKVWVMSRSGISMTFSKMPEDNEVCLTAIEFYPSHQTGLAAYQMDLLSGISFDDTYEIIQEKLRVVPREPDLLIVENAETDDFLRIFDLPACELIFTFNKVGRVTSLVASLPGKNQGPLGGVYVIL